jgi:hypothetical protein
MKRERLTPRDIAILVGVVFLAICCICTGTVLTAGEDFVDFLRAPLRWFERTFGSAEPDLGRTIAIGGDGVFTLRENCRFTQTRGSFVSSGGSLEQGNNRAGDLSRDEVIASVQAFLDETVFFVRRGELMTGSGTAVQTELLSDEAVYIRLTQDNVFNGTRETHSLEGVIHEGAWQGDYNGSFIISEVRDGQGIEEAASVAATLVCPLTWEE